MSFGQQCVHSQHIFSIFIFERCGFVRLLPFRGGRLILMVGLLVCYILSDRLYMGWGNGKRSIVALPLEPTLHQTFFVDDPRGSSLGSLHYDWHGYNGWPLNQKVHMIGHTTDGNNGTSKLYNFVRNNTIYFRFNLGSNQWSTTCGGPYNMKIVLTFASTPHSLRKKALRHCS